MPKWILFLTRAYAPLASRFRLIDAAAHAAPTVAEPARGHRANRPARLPTIATATRGAAPRSVAA